MSSLLPSTRNTRALPVGDLKYIRSDCPDRLTDEEVMWLRQNDIEPSLTSGKKENIHGGPAGWNPKRVSRITICRSRGAAACRSLRRPSFRRISA